MPCWPQSKIPANRPPGVAHISTIAGQPEGRENRVDQPDGSLEAAAAPNLTRKASLNSVAQALEYGARVGVGFLLQPLLVVGLGVYGYGAWQVVSRLVGYIDPASGRAGHALRWTIASQQASTDVHRKRQYVGSALAVWAMFLPLIALIGAALAWLAPTWLGAPPELTLPIRLAVLLLSAKVAVAALLEIPRSVLEGENLGYKRMGLSALVVCVGGGLMALAVSMGFGLSGVACATLLTSCLTGALFISVTKSNVSWFGLARPTLEGVKRFMGLSGWFVGWQVVVKLMRASDVVVLGLLASIELVTIYTLTKYVPETAINLVAILVFGITPGLGGIIGKGDLKKAARIRTEILAYTWIIATVSGATVLLWNATFVELWVGGVHGAGMLPTLLIVLMVTQFVVIRTDGNVIDLTLNLKWKVILGLASAMISIGSACLFVGVFEMGIEGLCLGIILGRLILTVSYPWIVGRFLDIPFIVQLRSAVRPILVSSCVFATASWSAQYVTGVAWIGLIGGAAATFVVLSIATMMLGLSREIRARFLHRLGRVIGSRTST